MLSIYFLRKKKIDEKIYENKFFRGSVLTIFQLTINHFGIPRSILTTLV